MLLTDEIRISLPPTWRRRSDPERGVLVAARAARLPLSGVAPEAVVRCVPVDTDDLAAWRDGAMADLGRRLADFEVEDQDGFDLAGLPTHYHRFAHRLGVADVLCEQWAWLVDGPASGLGVTLTCAVAREEYPDYCDLFEEVAQSVRVGSRAA